MNNLIDQLTTALDGTQKGAESVVKLTKLFKEAVGMYSDAFPASTAGKAADGKNETSALEQMALEWSHLPGDTRRDLIEPIRATANGNETVFVREIFSQLMVLASMTQPVANLAMLLGKSIKNQEEMLGILKSMDARMTRVERHLDERVMVEARQAISLLTDAANVKSKSVRDQNLQTANGVFTKLTALDPNETTQGTSATKSNKELIALGYWGRHLILGMQDETRYALVQVYECTQKYPLESMMIFEPAYFSKDYRAEMYKAWLAERALQDDAAKSPKDKEWAKVWRGDAPEKVLARGLYSGIMFTLDLVFGSDTGASESNKSESNKMKETRERLAAEIQKECSERLKLLTRIDVADLRKVIVMPANVP